MSGLGSQNYEPNYEAQQAAIGKQNDLNKINDLISSGDANYKNFQSSDHYDSQGDPTEIINSYNDWLSKQGASDTDHKTYVDMVNGNQGRAATMIVQPNSSTGKTILTSPAQKKTVLG